MDGTLDAEITFEFSLDITTEHVLKKIPFGYTAMLEQIISSILRGWLTDFLSSKIPMKKNDLHPPSKDFHKNIPL